MVSQHLRVNLEAAVVDSLHLLFCCFLPELQHEQKCRQAFSNGVAMQVVAVESLHLLRRQRPS